jgi:hypothetical protein
MPPQIIDADDDGADVTIAEHQPIPIRATSSASVLGGERMMLVRDHPASTLLSQTDGQREPIVRITPQLIGCSASEQGPAEGKVVAHRDVELDDIERRTRSQPFEEWRPRAARPVDAARAISGGGTSNMTMSSAWSARTVSRSPWRTALSPALDQRPDLGGVVRH